MGNQSSAVAYNNTGVGNITVIGTVTGGSTSSACGITTNLTSNTVNVTGVVTGGTTSTNFGCSVPGVLNINGLAVGGIAGAGVSAGTAVNATRAVGNGFGLGSVGLTGAPGIANTGTAVVEVRELEYGSRGMSPVTGIVRLKKDSLNQAIFNWVDSGAAKILVDATQGQMPAITDVRSGVSYASGALTGSAFIPSPSTVATGVPVDNTVGTAALSASDVATAVWATAARTITGGTVDTVPTPSQIASQVRTELGTELGRIDTTISSRLAPSGTLARVTLVDTATTLTNAPASVTPSDIWSHSTRTLTSASGPTAVEIRQEIDANSTKLDVAVGTRLADADYVEPANSDVAAIKAKTDALPSDPADQSLLEAAIAGVTAPSAATVAAAVRSELSTELSKVSALNTERLANCATTAIVGNLLAQANS